MPIERLSDGQPYVPPTTPSASPSTAKHSPAPSSGRNAPSANDVVQHATSDTPVQPKWNDFKGVPPQMRREAYQDAMDGYEQAVDEQAAKQANEIIASNGGNDSHLDFRGAGKDLANLARTNPSMAGLVGLDMISELKGKNPGDNVSQAMVQNLSDAQLRALGQNSNGAVFLQIARNNLLAGNASSSECRAAGRIDQALTGFDPNSLTGDPQHDSQTVDSQLKSLPAAMRDSYVQALLANPLGRQAILRAATLSPQSQTVLGKSLGDLYAQDPATTGQELRLTENTRPSYGGFPYYQQSGLASVVAQSGNDGLINEFARNEINNAKSSPDGVRGYLNAVTAWAGLSPGALQSEMKSDPNFMTAVNQAGRLTSGPASSLGFANYNLFEPGLGNLLQKASEIRGPNGQSTPEAMNLFATVVKYAGGDFATQQGAGQFFIQHAKQLVSAYCDPRSASTFNPDILQTFFANVVYAPDANALQYQGKPLVAAVIGDGKGNGGALGSVAADYFAQARQRNTSLDDHQFAGETVGYLWGALSGGLLDSAAAYKDQFAQDKAARDFAAGLLKQALGTIADKVGIPGPLVDNAVDIGLQTIDAGQEQDEKQRLNDFKTIFNQTSTAMMLKVTALEVKDKNVQGLQAGFLIARDDYLTSYLVNSWISN